MTAQSFQEHPFITHLEELREDRAALAALRRGLGQLPGYAPEMFPYVVPFLPNEPGQWRERVFYMIASLFGLHPESAATGNLGSHFAALRVLTHESPAVERRFIALLAAHPDDLDFYLRQAISLLKSKEVAVNWHQLLSDVLSWNSPDRLARVHRQWAREFWQ